MLKPLARPRAGSGHWTRMRRGCAGVPVPVARRCRRLRVAVTSCHTSPAMGRGAFTSRAERRSGVVMG